jgi:hypothetical protein
MAAIFDGPISYLWGAKPDKIKMVRDIKYCILKFTPPGPVV